MSEKITQLLHLHFSVVNHIVSIYSKLYYNSLAVQTERDSQRSDNVLFFLKEKVCANVSLHHFYALEFKKSVSMLEKKLEIWV